MTTDQFLAIALSRGSVARRGPTPDATELRRTIEALAAVLDDALLIIRLRLPAVEEDSAEFMSRAFNVREYATALLERMS